MVRHYNLNFCRKINWSAGDNYLLSIMDGSNNVLDEDGARITDELEGEVVKLQKWLENNCCDLDSLLPWLPLMLLPAKLDSCLNDWNHNLETIKEAAKSQLKDATERVDMDQMKRKAAGELKAAVKKLRLLLVNDTLKQNLTLEESLERAWLRNELKNEARNNNPKPEVATKLNEVAEMLDMVDVLLAPKEKLGELVRKLEEERLWKALQDEETKRTLREKLQVAIAVVAPKGAKLTKHLDLKLQLLDKIYGWGKKTKGFLHIKLSESTDDD